MASTYSSGGSDERQVVTTDLRHICTERSVSVFLKKFSYFYIFRHTGTSASAPIAAAIIALALEANKKLSWRDMQHLVVQTSKRQKLNAPDWATNGVGREYSHRYGYGLMDAGELVHKAKNWRNMPEQQNCTTIVLDKPDKAKKIDGEKAQLEI